MNRYPYHRYLSYLVLEGDQASDIIDHIGDGLGYVPPTKKDVEFLISTLRANRIVDAAWRESCDVTFFDVVDDEDMDVARWLVDHADPRAVIERALLDKLTARQCATVATMKFGRTISEQAIAYFRRGWWDTDTLNAVDFVEYYRLGGARKPDPPGGVPLNMRPAAAAWREGLLPSEDELSTDDMMRAMQVDSFMEYQKLRVSTSPSDQAEARKWATMAIRLGQIRKPVKNLKSASDSLPLLKPAVFYPKQDTPTFDQLRQSSDDDGPDDKGK